MTRINLLILTLSVSAACWMPLSLTAQTKVNDSTTPLHALQPEYKYGYGIPSADSVKATIDRVAKYLEAVTPARLTDRKTGQSVADYTKIDANTHIEQGDFRLTSYEWGVTYAAMLTAYKATGDRRYLDYTVSRLRFLADVYPHFRKLKQQGKSIDPLMEKVVAPAALDDAGAVCVSMIKAMKADPTLPLNPLIENYMDYILHHQYRLSDGTLARTRPQFNTLWLDDMFMGIPPIAWYATYKTERSSELMNEAVGQVKKFAGRMWVGDKHLFRHGWVESMDPHPSFFWGRANGWALLTLCEVLDALPSDHAARPMVMRYFQQHLQGLLSYQSGDGFWHQLLDRPDSYEETSATAIYVYCMAHAINQGWIDAKAFGPSALLGWHAVASQVTQGGQVAGVCVGTGMAFDPAFYYYRPVNVYAAHGYGPVILAGAEVIRLINNGIIRMNDSAVHFYKNAPKSTAPIFYVDEE